MPAVLADTPAASALRRRVGPVAWCALEVLVARSQPVAGGLLADASVRVIAAELGIATNTAHRALKTLRAAAVVEPAQGRNAGGRFGTASYLLFLPAEMLPSAEAAQQPKHQVARRPAPPARAAAVVQLVLVPSE